MKKELRCPVCGKVFIGKKTSSKYCSDKCSRIGRRRVPRVKCLNCGKEFVQYSKTQKYCNKKCKNEHKVNQDKIIYTKKCQECGKEYEYYNSMPNWFGDGQNNSKKYHGVDSKKYCCYKCGILHRQRISHDTCLKKYGVEFSIISENNIEKSKQTKIKKYGDPNYKNIEKILFKIHSRSEEEKQKICDKIKQTKLKKYGNENYNGSDKETEESKALRVKRTIMTKKKNHTFNTSSDEQVIKKLLKNKFKEIKTQYKSEIYPFVCDFYIPEKDLYIEYQGMWTHGKSGHKILGAYDKNNIEHQTVLRKWEEKAKKSKFYKIAIRVWTVTDPLKREVSRLKGINWMEFFTIDEFLIWYNSI